MRVEIRPEMLAWARERSGLGHDAIVRRFPRLAEWETGVVQPTFKQLEKFSKATHTPIGFMFLATPPEDTVPIPDFRTIANQHVERPSPDLLDTIFHCQRRQDWYRDYARANNFEPLEFVSSVTRRRAVEAVAGQMRDALGFDLARRAALRTWVDALREFITLADDAGVLVMCSGIVGNNTHRKLNAEEFRGFALVDDLAPTVFINGADTKSAQMFTLAHELAHIWLGQTALSSAELIIEETQDVEQWCNAVAAEFLVPRQVFESELRLNEAVVDAMPRLARRFKVSTLVILRRLHDVGVLGADDYWRTFHEELARLRDFQSAGAGGNFYLSQAARVSKRFARTLIASTWEGQTLYRDAMQMLGVRKTSTFNELGRSLGMAM